jgi:hypothetical protein
MRNIYEWHNGGIYLLLAQKTNTEEVKFLDAGASGDDVFLATRQQLVPADFDFAYDAYDLKSGGGFPATSPPVPCDVASSQCQGAEAAVPASPSANSESVAGQGNPPRQVKKHQKKHRGKKHKKRKAHNHHRAQANGDRGRTAR